MVETTWVEIDLDNIKSNYINIRKKVGSNTHICGVVKANAYGHGAVDVARVLEWEGIDYLAVARLEEALELKKNGIVVPVLCLGYVSPENYKLAIKNNIELTIYSYENAVILNELARELKQQVLIHLKIDTGMGRIGFLVNERTIEEIKEISKLENLKIEGIYTHFSKADEEDKAYTNIQISRFDELYNKLKEADVYIPIRHVSNSAGVIDFDKLDYEMVRCGVILYGCYPSNEVCKESIDLKPAMTLKTRVAHIKNVCAGNKISYGGKYIVERDTYIATLPIGYADGFVRGQEVPKVSIKNKVYNVVGRICMDQCMVDLGENIDNIQIGDEVIIFGGSSEISVEDVASNVNTINYEILCGVSRRVDRVYLEEGKKLRKNYILD